MATMNKTYLTKSKFNLALDCPTKLFYAVPSNGYHDKSRHNDFLAALADGGYQLGELAKFKYHDDPIGAAITVNTLDKAQALAETAQRMGLAGKIVIAEAAITAGSFFIRVDILIKDQTSKTIQLIEVKAASVTDATIKSGFKNSRGEYQSNWLPYLYDIAFQAEVAARAYPEYRIAPRLLLVDSAVACDVDSLHQKFPFKASKNESGEISGEVQVPPKLRRVDLGDLAMLREVDVSAVVAELRRRPITNSPHIPPEAEVDLPTFMDWASQLCESGSKYFGGVSHRCKSCQFRADGVDGSGVHECWQRAIVAGQLESEHSAKVEAGVPLSIDLWGGGSGSISIAEKVLVKKRAFLSDIKEEDIRQQQQNNNNGMSSLDRRLVQIRIQSGGAKSAQQYEIHHERLKEMDKWEWPLHMIDFETTAPAIPFFAGKKPYQTIPFQFSHHVMEMDRGGVVKIRHANDWVARNVEKDPTIEFVRQLRAALMPDGQLNGTVFRYHNHENTVLLGVLPIIEKSRNVIPDAEDLISFIELITTPTAKGASRGKGADSKREDSKAMVDLHRLVQEGYYSSAAGQSVSLKYILKAILRDAPITAKLYRQPRLYGAGCPIVSRNFTGPAGHIWLQDDKGGDPYKTLEKIFEESHEIIDSLNHVLIGRGDGEGGVVNQGGIAMTAFNCIVCSQLDQATVDAIFTALLKYCELDTLAMVILVQGLMELRGRPLNISSSNGGTL